jgi:hypothetical protein
MIRGNGDFTEFVLAAPTWHATGGLLLQYYEIILRMNNYVVGWYRSPSHCGSFSGFYLRSHGDRACTSGHVPVDTNTEAETTVMKMISPTTTLARELRACHR